MENLTSQPRKRCSACGHNQPLSEFYKDSEGAGGRKSRCRTCVGRAGKIYRSRNRERGLKRAHAWRAKNKSRYETYQRGYKLKKRYGLTPEQYDVLFRKQKGVCAICGRPPPKRSRLAVDHNHKTAAIRGLLCHLCN